LWRVSALAAGWAASGLLGFQNGEGVLGRLRFSRWREGRGGYGETQYPDKGLRPYSFTLSLRFKIAMGTNHDHCETVTPSIVANELQSI
jgi:hypothetical protein